MEQRGAVALRAAQHAGDRDHALQMQGEKIAAGFFAAGGEGQLRDFGIGEARRMVVQTAQAGDIGNRLDVEYQHRRHSTASLRTPCEAKCRLSLTSASCWIWRTRSRVSPISSASSSSVAGSIWFRPKRRSTT